LFSRNANDISGFRPHGGLVAHANITKLTPIDRQTDFIVVGAGVAGLRAAIALAEAGRVLVVTKQELTESATQYAQGGIAVALSDEDEIGLHLQDTIDAGDGIVNVDAAQTLVEEGPARIHELLEWGTQFDRTGTLLTFAREAAHSRSRILHAHGDSTGREIGRALAAKARTLPQITFREFEFTSDVCIQDGRATGVTVLSGGQRISVAARSVLLATGGGGQLFRDTTNPSVATADGVAMGHRAGAVLSDMEFVQFHPTALYLKNAPRFLLSEALRGEGGRLINGAGERFMARYDSRGELAARDIVARAIATELAQSASEDPACYLDLRHLDSTRLKQRFPRIFDTCLRHGLDITREPVPIRPAAHYMMGGIKTDLFGASSIAGLYAAGETGCTGVHGANRLASNSLLEGLVFGARAGEAMRQALSAGPPELPPEALAAADDDTAEKAIEVVRNLMWRYAGVVREQAGMQQALSAIVDLAGRLPAAVSRRSCEARNIVQTAALILRSALARQESRGAHFRRDFPQHDDERFRKHSVVLGQKISFEKA